VTTRTALASGAREAFGVPAAVLAAGYLGFGALVGDGSVSLWFTLVSTLAIWALPGQLILFEMWQVGAPMVAVVLAVMLANARFLPMAMTLTPVLRDRAHPRIRYYLAAHLIAMTAWAVSMRRCPDMPGAERLFFLTGFGLVCLVSSMIAAAAGFLISDSIPATVQLGLVFLSPIYFLVILIAEARNRLTVVALACGAVAGPLCHLLSPQWGVLLAGVCGGTAAFLILKFLRRQSA
jgi:predicted branched-subunit amino acid permease